jgi:ankyrin repeat protein
MISYLNERIYMNNYKKFLSIFVFATLLQSQSYAMKAEDVSTAEDSSLNVNSYLTAQIQTFVDGVGCYLRQLESCKEEIKAALLEYTSEHSWNDSLRLCYALNELKEIPLISQQKALLLFLLGKQTEVVLDDTYFKKLFGKVIMLENPILANTLLTRNSYLSDCSMGLKDKYSQIAQNLLKETIKKNDMHKVRFLVNEGIVQINSTRNSPLIVATKCGQAETVQFLLDKGANTNAIASGEITALVIAAQKGDEKITELLLAHGASVNKPTVNGVTPLIYASHNGHLAVVTLLLKAGADVSVRDEFYYGKTAFMTAAEQGHLEIVNLLLNGYVDIHDKIKPDYMGFVCAAREGHVAVVELLMSKGMDVDTQTPLGWTALMSAARHGKKVMVKWLLAHRADKSVKNNEGDTAFNLAKEKKHYEIASLLINNS